MKQDCCFVVLLCRQDALAASTALHSQVEQLKGELAAESTSISHLRKNVSAAAQQEAQTVAQLQGQVSLVVIRNMPEAWAVNCMLSISLE